MDEKLYQKGFNHGYTIAQHEPELWKKLSTASKDKEQEYFKGLTAGGRQQVRDKIAKERSQDKAAPPLQKNFKGKTK